MTSPRRSARTAVALAALGLLALVSLLAAPTAGARSRNPCKPRHAKTLAVSTGGRIFSVTRGPDVESTSAVYACRSGSRHRVGLGGYSNSGMTDGSAELATLSGSYAAVVTNNQSESDCLVTVHVANLRSRTVRHVASLPGVGGCGKVKSLALSSAGTAGWVALEDVFDAVPAVRALDAGGARTLEQAPGIDPTSLAIGFGGHVLYWTRAGTVRSAPLS